MAKKSKVIVPEHKWAFKARFRRGAFGWRSQPAIVRVREAISEVKKVARKSMLIAAEGAVSFIERVSAALEHVDSSSGAIGSAVNKAIEEFVPVIAGAPADDALREHWLERLFQAQLDDDMPFIELLGDYWGDLCVSKETASAWADRLVGDTRRSLFPKDGDRVYFPGISACLSALFKAERYDELIELVVKRTIWTWKQWAVKALVAQGKLREAIEYAEACRADGSSQPGIDRVCEDLLISSGQADLAFERYAISANYAGTNVAWFRNVAKKYPEKPAAEILAALVKSTPGAEGKWFAAAKDAGVYDEAIELARRSPTDPKTLTRASRDFVETNPEFAHSAAMLALYWLCHGYGYEVTNLDFVEAFKCALQAAEKVGKVEETAKRAREYCMNSTDKKLAIEALRYFIQF